MISKLMVNNNRAKHDGEIFTPIHIVRIMLNQPEIKNKLSNLRSTFMENSAGTGAFTCIILATKLKVALHQSLKFKRKCTQTLHFNRYVLIALSSIYGIEILSDNVDLLHKNMLNVFIKGYLKGIKRLQGSINDSVITSAKSIIKANLVQGNALTGKNKNKKQIILNEWKPVSKFKVRRKTFSYYDMINRDAQLDLFKFNTYKSKIYSPVDITKIYKHS